MEGKRQALLLWLQDFSEREISSLNDLRTGHLLQIPLSQIEEFPLPSDPSDITDKDCYNNLKAIYEQVNGLLQKNTKVSLPSQINYMNLIQMAQGNAEEGLQSLLHLVFIVCIQSKHQQAFIRRILQLPRNAQQELMLIIQESTAVEHEQLDERDSRIQAQKETISKLEFAYNSQVTENEGLRVAFEETDQRLQKIEKQLESVRSLNRELKQELQKKNDQVFKLREQIHLQGEEAGNSEMFEELKSKMVDSEEKSGQEIISLNEKIGQLQREIVHLKRENDLLGEQQASRNLIQGKSDHTNCISLEKHKQKLNDLITQNKDLQQKQFGERLQTVKLKNKLAELQSKNKRLQEELHHKNEDLILDKGDADKLKIQFFTRIRDSLKTKLKEFNHKEEEHRGFQQNVI